MKTDIYYYSGTGNSLWTARRLAEELGDATLHPISKIYTNVYTLKKKLSELSSQCISGEYPVRS